MPFHLATETMMDPFKIILSKSNGVAALILPISILIHHIWDADL
tara:strand:+ start:257266 stop:257397 length:132 start_codon:yes stop_codon:yes gene_type:complete